MSADSSAAAMSDVNASAGVPRKRPRHFWEGPDPGAEQGEAEEKQQGSPVARLYQHALESVFGFLSLADLSRAMSVSRPWSAAVSQMPCVRLTAHCTMARLVPLCSSTLSKHTHGIASFASNKSELTCEALYTLSLAMPQLINLDCSVLPSEAAKVILPHRLQTLQLDISNLNDAAINAVIKGISQLNALDKLTLTLPSFLPAISFGPLAAVPSLQELELSSKDESQPTQAQLDQFRALPQLRKMSVVGLSSQSLAQLLRTPHELRWQQIHGVKRVDAAASAALSSLSSLTTLNAWGCAEVGFLARLSQLRTLNLFMPSRPWPATITADAVVDGLSSCTQLTSLLLAAPLNSKHLSVLLPRLPLSALEYLTIENSFTEPLSKLDVWLHTPPSRLMPRLKKFTYIPLQ